MLIALCSLCYFNVSSFLCFFAILSLVDVSRLIIPRNQARFEQSSGVRENEILGEIRSDFSHSRTSDVLAQREPGYVAITGAAATLIAIMREYARSLNWVSATYVIRELRVAVCFVLRN